MDTNHVTNAYPQGFQTFFALPVKPEQGQVVTAWLELLKHYFQQPGLEDFEIESFKAEPKAYRATNELRIIKMTFQKRPVLFALVNDPSMFDAQGGEEQKKRSKIGRQNADEEIRHLMRKALPDLDIKLLYGISAFGTSGMQYRVYTLPQKRRWDHRTDIPECDVEPCPTPPDIHLDTQPVGEWRFDISSQSGQAKIISVFQTIMDQCALLLSERKEYQ